MIPDQHAFPTALLATTEITHGCRRLSRYDCTGLWLLRGRPVVALTDTSI